MAMSVLRNQGFVDGLNERTLGSLLMLMQTAGLVTYSKKTGSLVVHVDKTGAAPPRARVSTRLLPM